MPSQSRRPDPDPPVTTETPPPADPPVTTETTKPEQPKVLISEGMRTDLEAHGQVTDPASGLLLKRDKRTGEVTATNRATGAVTVVVEAKK